MELSHRPVELLAVSSSEVCTVVWMESVDERDIEAGNEDPRPPNPRILPRGTCWTYQSVDHFDLT